MASGSDHIAPGLLGWQLCLATWHQGGLDGNMVWPHGTRVAGMATGPGKMTVGWLGWQQSLATWQQGGWDGNRAACMATVPGHMAQGWLDWQQGLAKSTRESGIAPGPGQMPPGKLRWQQGMGKWHQRGWGGNRAWPHGTREDEMATGSGHRVVCIATVPGHMAPGWLGWHQGLATCHKGG